MVARALVVGALFSGALASPGGAAAPLVEIDCDPTPFPVTQSIRLAKTVFDCPGAAMVVMDDDITIDLNGQMIDGDGGTGDYGIDNSADHTGLTIKNGVVREFDHGVHLDDGSDNVISGLTFVKNENAVYFETTANSRIEGNLMSRNPSDAIVFKSGSDSNEVLNNTFASNGSGIVVDDGASFNIVRGNRFIDNSSFGVFVAGDDNTIESNVVSGGGDATGIETNDEGQRNVFRSNKVLGMASNGILVGGDNFKLIENVSSGNDTDGIQITATADGTKLKRNVTKYNNEDGIDDNGTNTTGSGNKSSNNTVDQCPPVFCHP